MNIVILECPRTDYSAEDVQKNRNTMKVKELKEILERYDDDDIIVTSHDNGYTYGPVSQYNFREEEIEEDEEYDEENS